MPIEIELPDKSIAEFPDGMSDEEIASVLKKQFPPQPPPRLPEDDRAILSEYLSTEIPKPQPPRDAQQLRQNPDVVGVAGANIPQPTGEEREILSSPMATAMTPMTILGRPINAALQDAMTTIAGDPESGGNLYELFTRPEPIYSGQPLPFNRTLSEISSTHPATATAGKIASAVVESAPSIPFFPQGIAGRLVEAGFTAYMIANAGDAATRLGEEMGKPPEERDYDKITTALSEIGQAGAFAPVTGAVAGRYKSPRMETIEALAKQLQSEPIQSTPKLATPERRLGLRVPEELVNPLAAPEIKPIVDQAFAEASGRTGFEQYQYGGEGIFVPEQLRAVEKLSREQNPPRIEPARGPRQQKEGVTGGKLPNPDVMSRKAIELLEDVESRKPKPPQEPPSPSGTPVEKPKPPTTPAPEAKTFPPPPPGRTMWPAVRSESGKIYIGIDHPEATSKATAAGDTWRSRGYVNKTGEFKSLTEIAREAMDAQMDAQPKPAPEAKTPPLRPGDRLIKIEQPDGTVIEAVANGKNWEVGGQQIPNVGRAVEIEPGKMLWSDGPLRPGERILESSLEKSKERGSDDLSNVASQQEQKSPQAVTENPTVSGEQSQAAPREKLPESVKVLHNENTGSRPLIAIKLSDGAVLYSSRWSAHIDAVESLPPDLLQQVVDSGFVAGGKFKAGGDLSQGLRPGESVVDYYGKTIPPSRPTSEKAGGVSDAIQSGIEGIESLQQKLRKGPQSGQTLMGVPSAILDTALEAARLTLKAGKPIAEAIEAAIRHIRYNVKGKWNEKEIRALIESAVSPRSAVPKKDQPTDGMGRRGMVGVSDQPVASATGAGAKGSVAEPAVQINPPEGQKPRSFSARATVSEKIPEPVQEAIAKDPRSSYTPQKIADVKEQVRSMSDAELGALTPESDIYTEGRAELANRLFDDGKLDAGLDVIQGVSENLTRLGQLINQAKVLNALKPENQVLAIDRTLQKAGKDPLNEPQKRTTLEKGRRVEDTRKRLDDATRDWQRNPTPENAARAEKALDIANDAAIDFQRWAHRFEPKTTPGILKAILQGNLLTPMSQTANLIGNMSFLPFRIGTRSLATGMNIVQSAIYGQPRTASVGPVSGTIQAAKGLARGASEIPSILRRGTGDAVVGERKTQLNPIKAWINQFSKNPEMPTVGGKLTLQDRANLLMEGTIGVPAEAMLRLLGAGDRPFREAARYRATAEQLRLAKVPKEQWDFAQKFPELFFSKEQLAEIKNQSDFAVFQRQSKTLNVIQRWIAEKGPWFDFAVATVAPYKVTPWNIIGEILSYNPVVAFTKATRDAVKGNSRSANINASKFIVGGLMTTAATVLYQNGLLSPSLDANDETMKERILSGKVMPPNHINISGLERWKKGGSPAFQPGDKTVDIMRGGGLFGAFAYMVANVGRDLEKSPDAGTDELIKSIITQSTLEQARFGMNQSFLSGVEGMLSAVKDGNADNYVQKWANTVTSVPIPNTLTALSRSTREFKPDLSGTTFKQKMENLFRNKLGFAGLDDYLPLKRGLWGEPLRETPEGRNALIYQLFDVSKGQQITSDPKAIELYRLWRKTDNTRVIPTPPSNKFTWQRQTYTLNPEQHEKLAIYVGEQRREIMDSIMQNPNFVNATDDEKIRVLSRIYDVGSEVGKARFWQEFSQQLEANLKKAGFVQPK